MTTEEATMIIAIATPISALVVWAMRATIAPLKVVINHNTDAMERVVAVLDRHDDKIADHEVRIVKVETVHELEALP